jgi:hypothetical protein
VVNTPRWDGTRRAIISAVPLTEQVYFVRLGQKVEMSIITSVDHLPNDAIAGGKHPLKAFAQKYRLKGFLFDACGDAEITGRFGHLFQWSSTIFAVCLIGRGTQALERRKKLGLAAGLILELECDFGESILLFDPKKASQAKAAISIVGCRKKRSVSQTELDRLAAMRANFPPPTSKSRAQVAL